MTAQSEWHSKDDLERDLWYYSEISDSNRDNIQEPPSASILQWRAQVSSDRSSSIFDTPHNEDVTYVCSGRGRGGISKIFRPGLPVRDQGMMEEDYIGRKIREVSGLGYSNELIENCMKGKMDITSKNDTKEFVDAEYSSKSSTSAPKKPSSSLAPSKSQDRRVIASPRLPIPLQEDKPQTPPPLSVILGRRKNNKNLVKKPEETVFVQSRIENDAMTVVVPDQPEKVHFDTKSNCDSTDVTSDEYWWSNGTLESSSNCSDDSTRGSPGNFNAVKDERRIIA